MENSVVGIKTADGSFAPILDETEGVRKRVVLTTVRDDQETVQIDLFRGEGEELINAVYIGSLMIEHLPAASAGSPEIELTVGVDPEGNLLARARDRSGADEQSLHVNIRNLPEESIYRIPDFELESRYEELDRIESYNRNLEETSRIESQPTPRDLLGGYQAEPPRDNRHFILGVALIAGSVIGLALILTLFLLNANQPASPVQSSAPSQTSQPAVSAAPSATSAQAAATPALSAATARPATLAPAATPAQAAATPRVANPQPATQRPAATGTPGTLRGRIGVWYYLSRGDNLWNLAKSFYRKPLDFLKIARENMLKNPDFVLEGQRIFIPDVEAEER